MTTPQVQIYGTHQLTLNQGIKALVYGKAGVGKTVLATTCEAPFVVMTEPGLLSLRKHQIPFTPAMTVQELYAVADWMAGSNEAKQFKTFFIDSLTEVLEILLASERIRVGQKEPRKAYNELLIIAVDLIRRFRDLTWCNIIFIAKEEYSQDENGAMMYRPKFPGRATGSEAPYLFDEVWQMFIHRAPDNTEHRALRCHPTNQHEAKDRSGALAPIEPANLAYVFDKISKG